jgi:hypothetical protein
MVCVTLYEPPRNSERFFTAARESAKASWTPGRAIADRWRDASEIEAAGRGLALDRDYWTTAREWIAAERAARRPGW